MSTSHPPAVALSSYCSVNLMSVSSWWPWTPGTRSSRFTFQFDEICRSTMCMFKVWLYVMSFSSPTVHCSSHYKSKPYMKNTEKYLLYTALVKSKSRGHSAQRCLKHTCKYFFHQLLHWLLHAKQFTEEDFPLPLYVAVWCCSYEDLSPEVVGLL